jgi:hypothetical protein
MPLLACSYPAHQPLDPRTARPSCPSHDPRYGVEKIRRLSHPTNGTARGLSGYTHAGRRTFPPVPQHRTAVQWKEQ